tara:strand:- start:2284 stop:2544 length:261 start_codon:yes stop_codon:yes gene_type:complete
MIDEMTIFGRHGCIYCDKAKELLERKSIKFRVKSLEDDFNGDKDKFRQAISENMPIEAAAFSTVPQVFMGKRHIGGYEELVRIVGE